MDKPRDSDANVDERSRAKRSLDSIRKSGGVLEARMRELAGVLRYYRRVITDPHVLAEKLVSRGVPPSLFGYRYFERETVAEYFSRHPDQRERRYEVLKAEAVAHNPLPRNIMTRQELPANAGWWGYSFFDVPERRSGETFLARFKDCKVSWYGEPDLGEDFFPALIHGGNRALDLREIRFRPGHSRLLRQSKGAVRHSDAVWFIERVYHNHSHWLTAHLPKLLLLRKHGLISRALLPKVRTQVIDQSLEMIGLVPEEFLLFDFSKPLEVEELTVLGTDRFAPHLLRSVPPAFGVPETAGSRRIFISRSQAKRRKLVNEDDIRPKMEADGFEFVCMENLSFIEQIELMKETRVLFGSHGAGLTNMMFCPPESHIVEIADPSFPNPNFYALASALGHHYWLLPARAHGSVHPLEKDLEAEIPEVYRALESLRQLN